MSTGPCARCGTAIPTDQFLCASCREEQVAPQPTRVAAQEQATDRADAAVSRERTSAPPDGRTWRGEPVPPGMILPSRTQYHGTMYGLIALGVVITLVLAVLVNKGVGPFTATDVKTVQTVDGPRTTATIHNQGEHAGRARCVARWTNSQGGLEQTRVVESDVITPGGTVAIAIPLAGLQAVPADVAVDCK